MIENQRVIIVAHYLLYGAAHALRDYLISQNIEKLLCVFLPLATQRNTSLIEYKKSKINKMKVGGKKDYNRSLNLGPLDYLIDIFQTFWFVYSKEKYQVYFGFDCLNCLTGLFLKKIKKVDRVIFYSIDFVPIRFTNSLLNYIYHQIEIYCVKHADEVWNVSPRIATGREKFLHVSAKKYKQTVVPIGVWNDRVVKRDLRDSNKHQLLFMGHILEKQGVQKVLEALPLVIKKIPDVHLTIVGDGEYAAILRDMVRDLALEKHITFTGWIKKREVIDDMISESAVAIATYKPEKKQLYNFTYYADPTKLKDYLSAGLPIILTDISYNAQEIAKRKCGILVEYKQKDIADAILRILKDEKILKDYRNNALSYAQEFDWNTIFARVKI
jgi:glycosyltransferase involved in cell wall biosynthesis